MTEIALILAPAFGLAVAVLWRATWRLVALYALLMSVSLVGAVEMRGDARPLWSEWREISDTQVIAAAYEPETAIYVWVQMDRPRAYVLPWSAKEAKRLQEGLREAGNGGRRLLFDYSGGEMMFHPEPQQAPPPKTSFE